MYQLYKSGVRFELGNHVGEDVFLYVPKILDDTLRSSNDIQSNRPRWVERYQHSEFGFELIASFPGDDGICELLLVFLAAHWVESHFLERRCIAGVTKIICISGGTNNRWGAMFVPVPEVVQAVEQYYIVPCLVRLYRRYPVSDRIRELAYLREVTVPERRFGVMKFKSKIVV